MNYVFVEDTPKGKSKISPESLRLLKLLGEIDDKYVHDAASYTTLNFTFKTYIKIAACFCGIMILGLLLFSVLPSGNNLDYTLVTLDGNLTLMENTTVTTDLGMCFLAYDENGTYIYEVSAESTVILDFVEDYYPTNRALAMNNGELEVLLYPKDNSEEQRLFIYKLSIVE